MAVTVWIECLLLGTIGNFVKVCLASSHNHEDPDTSRSHADIGTTGIIIVSVIGGVLLVLIATYIAYKCGAFSRCTRKVRPDPAHTVEASRGTSRHTMMTRHHQVQARQLPPPYSIDTTAPPPYCDPPDIVPPTYNPVGVPPAYNPVGVPAPPTYVQPSMPMYAPPQYMQRET